MIEFITNNHIWLGMIMCPFIMAYLFYWLDGYVTVGTCLICAGIGLVPFLNLIMTATLIIAVPIRKFKDHPIWTSILFGKPNDRD